MQKPKHLAASIAIGLAGLVCAASVHAAESVSYGLNWLPQAEHCGFYQAMADGTYAAKGINVEIVPGGPSVNMQMLMANGRVDLAMGTMLNALKSRQQGVPAVTVATFFLKDPQSLVAHPDPNVKDIADLKGRPMMIGNTAREGYWLWLKAKYGFTDDQLRPYTFNAGPFLADPKAVQQGYVTNDAYVLGGPLGKDPLIFVMSDYGWLNAQTTVIGMESTIAAKPAAIKAFVDGSIEGWKKCLAGNYAEGKAAVLKANPDHKSDLFDVVIQKLVEHKILTGADNKPIGSMSDAQWAAFYNSMADSGVMPRGFDYKSAYTLKFVTN